MIVTPRDAGEAVVQFTATDPSGLTATQTFDVVVFPAPDPSSFDIFVHFFDDSLTTSSQREPVTQAMGRARERWEDVITGNLPSGRLYDTVERCPRENTTRYSVHIDDLLVFVRVDSLLAPGTNSLSKTLARAGPCGYREDIGLPGLGVIPLTSPLSVDKTCTTLLCTRSVTRSALERFGKRLTILRNQPSLMALAGSSGILTSTARRQ